ncbi:glycosyltransferase [Novosphingobium colocasiae]|uniref:glycosyltransferase n=1 Tax=Novosphingobium colocasiae TaxID=1256513 RepID=UPI0035B1D911
MSAMADRATASRIIGEAREPARPRATPSRSRGNVLFVSRQRIVGPTNGSSAYLLDLAQAVRRAGFIPHLLQPSPDLIGRWPWLHLGPELGVFASHRIRGLVRLGRWVIAPDPRIALAALRGVVGRLLRRAGCTHPLLADRPRPYAIAAPWTARDRAFLRQGQRIAPAVVIADYAFQTPAFAAFPGVPAAVVMHDLFHRRDGGGEDSVALLSKEQELALLGQADAAIAIQSAEAGFVRDHLPGVRPLLVPMAVRPAPAPQPGADDRLLFVGSNTAPNVVGLRWFFDQVWPLVRRRRPAALLDIAGSVAAAFAGGGPPGVRFHGMVPRLAPLYAGAGVVISPLTFGSGLKIKLVEALAHGKAVVATAITLQGVEDMCAGAVAQADDPAHFAEAVVALVQAPDRRAALAAAALDRARRHFSPEACHAAFIAWLEEQTSPAKARC